MRALPHPVRNNGASRIARRFHWTRARTARTEDGRGAFRARIQRFCVRIGGDQPRWNDRANDRRASPTDEGVARPLLRQQFQIDGPAAAAGAPARASEQLQERHAGGDRFSAPADSASVRRRTVPAAKRADRRTLHGARKRIDGRFHTADRARAIRAGPHAGGRGGAAGDFPPTRRTDGADRRHLQDGARGQTRKPRGRRHRAKVRAVPAGIHRGVPEDADALARTGQ